MEHLSRACTGPRKIPKYPGWRSSSDPTLCAPGLLSPAQPQLRWEGAGGLWCWKGNLGPGQAGRVAESLERQPVPPAGPGEPEGVGGARGQGSGRDQREVLSWVSSSCMCLRVLAAGQATIPDGRCAISGAAERFQETARPSARANRPNARLRNQGGGGSPSPGTGPVTRPSRLCLALCSVQPPKRSLTWLRSGAGRGCVGP